ncbi:MBL fold metallo-hydrolase [Gloeocapsa sp. PCC 73106]|uniref:MBL fold metallo-hydrolase n=1 Tax=Gloeocapsa sp. PCC 73106 TaxID=102232 RepID=UPI0002AC4EAF|nr:MBL fold metallo-hydrolase [Gloeocapsa sp. PCC 73106]ELR96824.1 putative Zn-dependent hydrolase of beta-lactamase fold [Gloeocapsa sp. PCC 73106]
MKRKTFLSYAGASFLTLVSLPLTAQTQGLTIQWLGHTSFLFIGDGVRVLVNPFEALGCTAGYRLPKIEADLVLLSSLLLDEGAATDLPGNPQVIYEPGDYQYAGIKFQGVSIPHDREGGRRFGLNVVWRWTLGGINILHMGGAASVLGVEEKILMGTPDLALIPVGGGPKAYNPQEALDAIAVLNPKIVIPTQYLTPAADPLQCELVAVDQFIELAGSMTVQRLDSDTTTLFPQNLPPEGTLIKVFDYQNLLAMTK